jgi:WD40 repeat protein
VDERYLLVSQIKTATLCDLKGGTKVVQRITHGDPNGCEVALSPDGRRALCSRYYGPGQVESSKLYDLSSGTEITSMGTRGIALFTSDGKVVRLDGSPGSLWDVSGDKPIQTGKLPFSPGLPRLAALSRDDSRLAIVADSPPRLTVWDMKSGAEVWKWEFPALFPVQCVMLSPDGRYLITGNSNGTLYIFRLPAANS